MRVRTRDREGRRVVCRLLGYVARTSLSVIDVLGEEELESFTALTAVHGDGWGMAWRDDETGVLRSVTSTDSAQQDPTYARLSRERLGRAGMVHLRWATPGLPVAPENTHPFVEGDYAFAHNGHVSPVDVLERMLTPASRAALRGTTDSERYFRLVLQCIADCGDEEEGLRTALGLLVRQFPEASLNALLLTPAHMFGIHINSRAPAPISGLRRLFASDEEIPHRHAEDYFAMDYRLADDAVHVISSGIDPQDWTPVPENTAASVDLATLELRRLDL